MNGYQRICNMMEGKIPDRVPVMVHNFMHAAGEAGYTMKQFRNSPQAIADSFFNAAEKYRLDGILTDVDTALLAGACGAELDFPEDEPARVKHGSGSNVQEIIDKIDEKEFLNNERIQIYLEAVRILSVKCGKEIFLRGNADQGPFGLAFLLYGMENFLMDLMDEEMEEDIFLLLEKCYQVSLRFHQEVYKAGAHCTSFGDSASGPDLVSPDIYRKFAKPYQARLAGELGKQGIKTICHICGCTDAILQDMLETGCSGFELDYKTDIGRIKEVFKGKSLFSGNIDPSGIICMGSKETVEKAVADLLNEYKEEGRFILGAGCALPKETPGENICALVNAVEKFGYYTP